LRDVRAKVRPRHQLAVEGIEDQPETVTLAVIGIHDERVSVAMGLASGLKAVVAGNPANGPRGDKGGTRPYGLFRFAARLHILAVAMFLRRDRGAV
jgi:hypothetical protein